MRHTLLLMLSSLLCLAAGLAISCGGGGGDDDDDSNGEIDAALQECIAFYEQCYHVSAQTAKDSYCSYYEQYAGQGDCYLQAVEAYYSCVFENLDCETYDVATIQACIDAFEQAQLDCKNAANDDDDDDNDDNDDDSDDDDDDDDDDNDDVGYSCHDLTIGMVDTCDYTLQDIDGVDQTQLELDSWCLLSESLFPKTNAPFWQCNGECAFLQSCAASCFDDCMNPGDPGGAACDHTVHKIYACAIYFIFTADDTLWIPEMDMQKACAAQVVVPWDCYQTCVEDNACSNPPTQLQSTHLLNCMNAC